jgi:hypothetical protein
MPLFSYSFLPLSGCSVNMVAAALAATLQHEVETMIETGGNSSRKSLDF